MKAREKYKKERGKRGRRQEGGEEGRERGSRIGVEEKKISRNKDGREVGKKEDEEK